MAARVLKHKISIKISVNVSDILDQNFLMRENPGNFGNGITLFLLVVELKLKTTSYLKIFFSTNLIMNSKVVGQRSKVTFVNQRKNQIKKKRMSAVLFCRHIFHKHDYAHIFYIKNIAIHF